MNPKRLRLLGTIGGIAVLYLATSQFLKSYQEGSPKWNYAIMICGMTIILVYNVFNKKKKKP